MLISPSYLHGHYDLCSNRVTARFTSITDQETRLQMLDTQVFPSYLFRVLRPTRKLSMQYRHDVTFADTIHPRKTTSVCLERNGVRRCAALPLSATFLY